MQASAWIVALGCAGALLAQSAAIVDYGQGCSRQRASFYEMFPPFGLDLAGNTQSPGGFSMVPTGTGYAVLPLLRGWTPCPYFQSTVVLGDDQISPPQSLGFSLPYPGGATDQIWIGSNGFITLRAHYNPGCCDGNALDLLVGPPRICPLWMDLNPGLGGWIAVHQSTTPSRSCYVTFTGVPEYPRRGANTFQVAFHESGEIDVILAQCTNEMHTALIGFSPGFGCLQAPGMDLSQDLQGAFMTMPDQEPLSLGSPHGPVVGAAWQAQVAHVDAQSPFVFLLLGRQKWALGVDLSHLGMFGCHQYTDAAQTTSAPAAMGQSSLHVPVPADLGLVGQIAYVQAFCWSPTSNPMGITASNGLALTVGTF